MISAITFVVGKEDNQKSFTVDSRTLIHRSTYFRSKLSGPNADARKEIYLPEDDPEAFEVFIRYIESGNIESQSTRKVIDSFHLFQRYMIPNALVMCREYLLDRVTPDMVSEILEVAEETFRTSYTLWCHIFTCTEEVLKSESFCNLKKRTVSEIICQDIMTRWLDEGRTKMDAVSEITVYRSLVKWGKKESIRNANNGKVTNLRKILGHLLRHIRFLLMTKEEFEEVCKDEILTDQEQLEVSKAIEMGAAEIELPFLNLTKEVRRPFASTMCFMACCGNSGKRATASLMTLRFWPESHDLFIYGITLHDPNPKKNHYIIKVKNLTRREERQEKISQETDNGSRFLLFPNLFVQTRELCTITLQTETPVSCCQKKCDTHPLLQGRSDEDYFEFTENAHFLGILALPVRMDTC